MDIFSWLECFINCCLSILYLYICDPSFSFAAYVQFGYTTQRPH